MAAPHHWEMPQVCYSTIFSTTGTAAIASWREQNTVIARSLKTWYTTPSLYRLPHAYVSQRMDMFAKAQLSHVERLHGIGRQLAVLKRIYQSYDRIIARILQRQNIVTSGVQATTSADLGANADRPVLGMQASTGNILSSSHLGVALSAPTLDRFQRLKDNINLYALSEIQACLDEKDALVFLVSSS